MALPIRPPMIVHHMGNLDGEDSPANTLEGISASLDAGAQFIEVDIVALAQDDYLLVHDLELSAETTTRGNVANLTVAQARELICRYPRRDRQFHVPLLGDVVSLLRERGGAARLQLDFKNTLPFASDEPMRRLLRLIEPLGDRVIVSSGADWQLRRLRRLAPWLDLGFDVHFYIDWTPLDSTESVEKYLRRRGAYGYWDESPLAEEGVWPVADYLRDRCETFVRLVPGLSTFYISHKLLARSLDDGFNWAACLHDYGIRCDAWTLDVGNNEAETNVIRLLAAGVDQFTTNMPLALARLLGS